MRWEIDRVMFYLSYLDGDCTNCVDQHYAAGGVLLRYRNLAIFVPATPALDSSKRVPTPSFAIDGIS